MVTATRNAVSFGRWVEICGLDFEGILMRHILPWADNAVPQIKTGSALAGGVICYIYSVSHTQYSFVNEGTDVFWPVLVAVPATKIPELQ